MYNIEDIKNKIICGDNLEIMREIPDIKIDLIYLDPPFFSNTTYEKVWGDKDEIRSFEDRWKGGIENYISWMSDRLKEMHRILKVTGTIYLHCDYHASHYLKIAMDKIFGDKNFKTEIIWRRYPRSFGVKVNKDLYSMIDERIFVYTKSDDYFYNPEFESYPLGYFDCYKEDDNDGRGKYVWQYITGKPSDEKIKSGTIFKSNGNKWKYKKYYNEAKKGTPMSNVWTDIGAINGNSKERLGYPTQKPEKLLKRIILSSSKPNDIVLDPFSGGGTTCLVASREKRNFIGIEISLVGAKVSAKRCNISEKDIIGLPSTIDDLKKMSHMEFQQWACDKMQAKNKRPMGGADQGVDGIIHLTSHSLFDEDKLIKNKYNHCPIQVKHQESVGEIAVKQLFATMHDEQKKYGFIIAYSFAKNAYEKVAKYKNEDSVIIKLITAEDLCKVDKYNYED